MPLNLLKESKLLNTIGAKYIIRLLGVKRITKKFWYRWMAGGAEFSTIETTLSTIEDFNDWCPKWIMVAERYEKMGKAAKENGSRSESIINYFLKANVYYYLAQWAVFENNEEKKFAYRKSKDCFLNAGDHFTIKPQQIEIAYNGIKMPGYLRLQSKKSKSPMALFIHGMDSAKEELYWTEREAIKRGFSTIYFDGPGQGESYILNDIAWEVNFEKAIFTVLDYIENIPQIDTNRIYIVGISWGGFWALKTSALDKRIKGCASIGGPPSSNHFASLPVPIRIRFEKLFATESDEEKLNLLIEQMNLGKLVNDISCPVVVVHGKKDILVPFSLVEEMVGKMEGDVTFKVFEDGDHCCTQHAMEVRTYVADWLTMIDQRHLPTEES